ncbi:hypothetical protein HOLleu_37481 [Holothuria leucospilota]|uniref:DUF4371 domain-containing protein n=1 Tax=Holothuria leucospilota TaxID=206669 RepID=A0A9Q1BCC9_HOLLE|nr:hypothetical protein HOLleu_37481 [Holothuria leucospilota]
MKVLFNTAYFSIKQGMAFSTFPSLCDLQEANGVDVGSNYRNDKGAAQFAHAIAETIHCGLESELKTSSYIAVMSDGSTDISAREQEIVYVRFLQNDIIPKTKCIDEAQRKAKLRTLCLDGASVNMGSVNGVAALEKAQIPELIEIHCVAHNLELAVSDTLKSNDYLESFEDTAINI